MPAVTVLAVDAGLLIGGIVVVETVFADPGLGRMLVFAINSHDLPLLQAGMTNVPAEVARLLDLVYLPRRCASRYPHELSGGEKQRVGIAAPWPPAPTSWCAPKPSRRWTFRCRRW